MIEYILGFILVNAVNTNVDLYLDRYAVEIYKMRDSKILLSGSLQK